MFLTPSFMEMKNTPKFSMLLTLSFTVELVETEGMGSKVSTVYQIQ